MNHCKKQPLTEIENVPQNRTNTYEYGNRQPQWTRTCYDIIPPSSNNIPPELLNYGENTLYKQPHKPITLMWEVQKKWK